MLKRILSGALSITLLLTAAMVGSKNNLKTDNNMTSEDKKQDISIEGTNSIGKYIENIASDNNSQQIKKLNNVSSEYVFSVKTIEFDPEIGKIKVISSQSIDCELRISFIDDDTSHAVELKKAIGAGENIISELNVDVNSLPEYYNIKVVLTDHSGKELSSPFIFDRYTRFVQEMLASTVSDYDQDYVVNLDEDDTTNFFVMSKDTIMGVSTEDTNVLISADYDNDVYVFDNIDESIQSLKKGDHFFIRPTNNDIIAVNVDNIKISDNSATIKGCGEIDDMFEAVKIELNADNADGVDIDKDNITEGLLLNETNNDSLTDFEYTYSDSYKNEIMLSNMADLNSKEISISKEWKIPQSLNYNKEGDISTQWTDRENDIITAQANLGLTINIKLELTIDFYYRPGEISFASDASSMAEFKLGGTAAVNIDLCLGNLDYTFFGVIRIGLKPTITLGFEAEVQIKTTVEYHFNFKYIKDECNNEWSTDSSFGKADDVKNEFAMEGNVSVTFDLKPNISVISHKFIELELSVPIEFKINVKDNGLNETVDSDVLLSESNVTEETMHLCDKCLLITPTLTVSVIGEAKLPIIGKTSLTILEREFTFTKWFYSATIGKHGMDECPNVGYRTELHFIGNDKISNATLPVWIDGKLNTVTDTDGNIILFCKGGTNHTYSVTAGNETKNGSFSVKDSVSYIEIKLDNGGVKSVSTTPVPTNPTPTYPPVQTIESAVQSLPEDKRTLELGRLGEHITYTLYSNGDLHILGYGEMFNEDTDIKGPAFDPDPYGEIEIIDSPNGSISDVNKKNVKHVIFENYSEFMKEQLNSDPELKKDLFIKNNETKFAELYCNENKDQIISDYKKAYNFSTNAAFIDDNTDRLLDYYIKNNTAEFAEKYYNDHDDELKNELAAYVVSEQNECDGKVITTIGNQLFENCTNLETITYVGSENSKNKAFDLPPEITVIGVSAFKNCNSIDFGDLIFNENLRQIKSHAFDGCSGITSIYVPENVELVDTYSFSGCSNLKKVTFMNTDKDIWGGSLYGDNIEELVFAEARAFIQCYSGTKNMNFGELFRDPSYNFTGYTPKSLRSVTILGGDTIPDSFFTYLTSPYASNPERSLEIIELPAGLKYIGKGAFSGLDNLKTIRCSDKSKTSYNLTALLQDVEYIGDHAFANCKVFDFGDLILPGNLEYFGNGVFENCFNLKHLTIPSSDNYSTLPKDYLKNIKNLKTVVIPKNVTKIEEYLFGDPYSLDTIIYYEGTEEEWKNIEIAAPNRFLNLQNILFNYHPGDANCDGNVTLGDALAILQYVANESKYPLTEEGIINADIFNLGDGITAMDSMIIQQIDTGMYPSFQTSYNAS